MPSTRGELLLLATAHEPEGEEEYDDDYDGGNDDTGNGTLGNLGLLGALCDAGTLALRGTRDELEAPGSKGRKGRFVANDNIHGRSRVGGN